MLRPYEESHVAPYPTGPIGDVELPALGLPDFSDDEIEDALRGMGS